ncbi:MAG: beta-galactosidase [Planctomycetota bacterium]
MTSATSDSCVGRIRLLAFAVRLPLLRVLATGAGCCLLGLMLGCSTPQPPGNSTLLHDAFGVNMHPERYDAQMAERQFEECRKLGITQVRVAVEWLTLEPERNRYDFTAMDSVLALATKHGIEVLEVLCYNAAWNTAVAGNTKTRPRDLAAFGTFVEQMARRYRGKIRSWEVWNEPNADTFLSGPYAEHPDQRWRDYRDILEVAYRALKRVDPDNVVVFGGIAHTTEAWWRDLEAYFAAGALDFCDVLAIHPYAGGDPEDTRWYPRYIDEMLAVMARHGDARPVWITEVGYPTAGHELAVTEAQQADYLPRAVRLALARPQVKKVFWYDLVDGGESFGLLRADLTPKPAAASVQRLLAGAR